MTPIQKQRYHARLETWSKLTPEQRDAARKKYRAFKSLPPKERERVKQRIKDEQLKKAQNSTRDDSSSSISRQP